MTGRGFLVVRRELEFLGRTTYRSKDGESTLYFGVNCECITSIFESWSESVKIRGTGIMLQLKDLRKEAVKKFDEEPLTGAVEQRYRRVLDQLAWTALSRADLSFSISFLFHFQAKSNPAVEHCRRTFLKWLTMHLHFVQRMPATQSSYVEEPKEVISFCDASWIWIPFLESLSSTRSVASKSFRGRTKFQLYHLLRLKSFPLLKQPKKWYLLEVVANSDSGNLDQGSNWIRNYFNLIQQESDLDTIQGEDK